MSGFLSSGHRGLEHFLEVPRGCHPSLHVLSRSSGFQSSPWRGIRLVWSGWGNRDLFELRHDSRVCAPVSGGDRPPPEGRQQHQDSFPYTTLFRSQFSIQVERGLSGFLSSRFSGIWPHLGLRPEPQGSSPVLTWISGFLWSFNRGVMPLLVWRHGTQLPSRGVKEVSGFLSSWQRASRASSPVSAGA